MEVCYLTFKNLMQLIKTDTVYLAFCNVYGEYLRTDLWGRYEGLDLLKIIAKWGDCNVKSASPLDHSMEVVLFV
jgi:hypothetical protein